MKSFLSNHSGSFALFGKKLNSKYEGLFFWIDKEMYKTIANFDLKGKVTGVVDELWRVKREKGDVIESYWFAPKMPVMFYDLSKKTKFDLVLDFKKGYDNREWGRSFNIENGKRMLLVKFDKKNNSKESNGEEYSFWIAIYSTDMEFKPKEKWEKQKFIEDEKRKSPPFEKHVFRLGTINAKNLVVSCAKTQEEAIKLALNAWVMKPKLAKEAASTAKSKKTKSIKCAEFSLLSLQENSGLFAGLPWFFQQWARDELISVKALIKLKPELSKKIIFNWLDKLDGFLPGTLTTKIADSGWVFVRLIDLLKKIDMQEKFYILAKLDYFLRKQKLSQGLIVNEAKETWMDSISRDGACIEIQALALASCKLARLLKKPVSFEKELKEKVLEKFWNGIYLKDRANDDSVRPNLFIAAYVYPELLSKKEWTTCFDYVLPKLWLNWGGLSTINKFDSKDTVLVPNQLQQF